MPHHKRQNYLRTYRRRCALSQQEVAALIGCHDGMVSSRYELGRRRPSLKTLFAFELILRAPARQLFAGALCPFGKGAKPDFTMRRPVATETERRIIGVGAG